MAVVAGLLLLGAGATGIVAALSGALPSTAAVATDLDGNPVVLDPGVTPVPLASSKAVAETGDRLTVPSVGLDVPLGALNAVGGQITPPGFVSAYWVRNMGVSVADSDHGTVYVVMHSLRGGGKAPGNYLTDVGTGKPSVSDGATVTVAGVDYTVTGWSTVTKARLAGDSGVWADTPNRLVLITCLELPDGRPSVDNMIITAVRSTG